MKLSPRVKLLLALAAAVVLGGIGIGAWLYERGTAEQPAPSPTASAPPSVEPVPVQPSGGGGASDSGGASDDGGASPQGAPVADPDAAAREALAAVVPTWGSYDYGEFGTDNTGWVESWRDNPYVAESLVDQSAGQFLNIFPNVFGLGANAKVATLKDVQPSWSSGDQSGWTVTFDRQLTSADGSGAVNVTETVTYEFTVDTSGSRAVITGVVIDPGGDDVD